MIKHLKQKIFKCTVGFITYVEVKWLKEKHRRTRK